MGYRLFRQVKLAELDLTPGERLVAWAIADDANDSTRVSFMSHADLVGQTGLTEAGVSKALQRLAKRGLEFRISITVDKSGRPVFACRGRRSNFRVPELSPDESPAFKDQTNVRAFPVQSPDRDAGFNVESPDPSPQSPDESAPKLGPWSGPISSIPSISPQQPRAQDANGKDHDGDHSLLSALDYITATAGVDGSEAKSILDVLNQRARERGSPIRNPAKFVQQFDAGELLRELGCDTGAQGPHSNACRRGDSRECGVGWCECRCHRQPALVAGLAPTGTGG